jgi:hypothetical protein
MLIVVVMALSSPGVGSAAAPCAGDPEYQVYAAVLFPAQANAKTGPGGKATGTPREGIEKIPVEMQGIGPGPYAILLSTISAKAGTAGAMDPGMVEDFNRKNASTCELDGERFRSQVPESKKGLLGFVAEQERKAAFQGGGWDGVRRKLNLGSGLTSLSRVGFNAGQTLAVVDVQTVADYEMGIGYRVLLRRDPASQGWVIYEARVNRIF